MPTKHEMLETALGLRGAMRGKLRDALSRERRAGRMAEEDGKVRLVGGERVAATYDGRLRWSSKARRVDPCCMTMHEWAVLGRVYVAKNGIALRIDERRGTELRYCPFCGARAEGCE